MLEVLGGARTTMLVEIRYVSGEACHKDSIDSLFFLLPELSATWKNIQFFLLSVVLAHM